VVTASRQAYVPPGDEAWFDVEVAVEASPFAGTLPAVLTATDLAGWSTSLRGLDDGLPGRAVLGGGRALELAIDVREQVGGAAGRVALEVSATTSGDDPYPSLRFLVLDVEPSWRVAADRIDDLVG
jgi:hypothetical protein